MKKCKYIYFEKCALLVFFGVLFMSIGYASISNIAMNISGIAMAESQGGVFISDVQIPDNGEIGTINYYGCVLNSRINLGESDDSNITLSITVYNDYADKEVLYSGTTYDEGGLFYDNVNITYSVDLSENTVILGPKESITFDVTFSYVDGVVDNKELNSFIRFIFEPYFSVSYYNFTDSSNFPTIVSQSSVLNVNYLLADQEECFEIYMDDKIISSDRYNYDEVNGILSIGNVTGDLKIKLQRNLLLPYEVLGTLTLNNLTITALGGGEYIINGNTGEKPAFIRLSHVLYAVDTENTDLLANGMTNDITILQKNKFYNLVFNQLDGEYEYYGTGSVSNPNNRARFVFRKTGQYTGYTNFGYDLYSGNFSDLILADDLGMFSFYIDRFCSFENFRFKVAVYEDELENDYNTLRICDNNSLIIRILNNNEFIIKGKCSINGSNKPVVVDIDHHKVYIDSLPNTSNMPIKYHSGDRVRLIYKYISGNSLNLYSSSPREMAITLRDFTIPSSTAINELKFSNTQFGHNFMSELYLENNVPINTDVSISSIYISSGATFENFRFQYKDELVSE